MSERQTVSESKAKFHKEFNYVIPAIYRRLVDELIVELNLLRNQKDFSEDKLFSLGLIKTFYDFTDGYKPESHGENILNAICSSTGFNLTEIKRMADILIHDANRIDKEKFKGNINDKELAGKMLAETIGVKKESKYSRLTGIGLFKLIELIIDRKIEKNDDLENVLLIVKQLGFNKERIEKDINVYINSTEKVKKMMELIQINISEEKKRIERRKES